MSGAQDWSLLLADWTSVGIGNPSNVTKCKPTLSGPFVPGGHFVHVSVMFTGWLGLAAQVTLSIWVFSASSMGGDSVCSRHCHPSHPLLPSTYMSVPQTPLS